MSEELDRAVKRIQALEAELADVYRRLAVEKFEKQQLLKLHTKLDPVLESLKWKEDKHGT